MKSKLHFFGPNEFKVLLTAFDRAQKTLLATGFARADGWTVDLLARGVLKAARGGDLDARRLCDAACAHWVDTTITRNPPLSLTLH